MIFVFNRDLKANLSSVPTSFVNIASKNVEYLNQDLHIYIPGADLNLSHLQSILHNRTRHGVEKSMKNKKKMPGFGTHIF